MQSYKKWFLAWSILILCGFAFFLYMSSIGSNISTLEISKPTVISTDRVAQSTPKSESREAVAFISEVNGEVFILDDTSALPLKAQKILYGGEILQSSSGGTAEITFVDNSLVRLANSSVLKIQNANEVELSDGSLWARILKPLTNGNTFKIKTNDLSAGVRGTAINISATATSSTITVVDSSIKTGAVTVESGSGANTSLDIEQMLNSTQGEVTVPSQVDMQILLANPNINSNLKSDIIYLTNLSDAATLSVRLPIKMSEVSPEILLKIEKEIEVSLPKKEEIEVFFESKAIAAEYEGSLSSGWAVGKSLSRNAFMSSLIKWDNELRDLKNSLLDNNNNLPRSEESRKRIEEMIKNFDNEWELKRQEPIKPTEEQGAENTSWLTGVSLSDPNAFQQN